MCCVHVSLRSETVATVWLMVALLHCNWSYAVLGLGDLLWFLKNILLLKYILCAAKGAELLKCQMFQKCVSFEVTSEQQDLCPHVKLRRKIWLATWNFVDLQTKQLKSVWFLFVFTLTCWYEGCRCSAGGVLHSGIFFSCQWLWNSTYQVCGVFFLFCVTTGSRGAIYKCHLSNTFCTHVATCHPTPTSLLHCGNSPVTGIFLAKFRRNTADPIWALQMICVTSSSSANCNLDVFCMRV